MPKVNTILRFTAEEIRQEIRTFVAKKTFSPDVRLSYVPVTGAGFDFGCDAAVTLVKFSNGEIKNILIDAARRIAELETPGKATCKFEIRQAVAGTPADTSGFATIEGATVEIERV